MIIVDFQHLCYRNLFTCIYNAKPKKVDGKFVTLDFIPLFFHQMLTSLHYIDANYGDKYGEVLIALDGGKNWRKDIISKVYKSSRKEKRDDSEVNFNEYFEYQKELEEFLKGYAKVIRVDEAEADDIGYVLSQIPEQNLLITSDKDWKQHLIDNLHTDIYDPIKKEMLHNSKSIQKELKKFRLLHILIGDKVDEVPSVMINTQFSDDFKKFLNSKKLSVKTYTELKKLDLEHLVDEFEKENEIKAFKKPRFGEKTALKLMENPTKFLRDLEKKSKGYFDKYQFYQNFRTNRLLVDGRKLPSNVKEKIFDEYHNYKHKKQDISFLEKYNLSQCYDYKISGKRLFDDTGLFDCSITSFEDLF